MVKIVAMLRVKNGMLFITDWLERMDRFVNEIVVVDNDSTDGTLDILKNTPKVVLINQTVGFDEGRDRAILLDLAKSRKPDWMIFLDVDEIFENKISRAKIERLISIPFIETISFRLYNMWGDENHFQSGFINIKELSQPRRYLIKNSDKLYVPDRKAHVGIEGISSKMIISTIRLKHMCNLHLAYRLKVYENYIAVDPTNEKIYERDVKNLVDPGQVKSSKYKNHSIYIYIEYMMLNFIYIYYLVPRKVKKLVKNFNRKYE